jgi:hypothetical protein
MTITTNPHPDVPLPAVADADFWVSADPMPHRDVYTGPHCLPTSTGDPLRSPLVMPQAVQWADGSITSPSVSVECTDAPGLTSAEARELAAMLIAAADQIDGWVR